MRSKITPFSDNTPAWLQENTVRRQLLQPFHFLVNIERKENAAPPATPTSLRSAGCTVDKQHHCTSASNSPHGQHPARLHCINMQPKDWQVFTENNKTHPPENCIPSNCRKPALPKTATRLQESYSTPLKRTTHVPSDIHILRCIIIQPKDWETFLGSGKSNPPENCVHYNCRKPALLKTAARLPKSDYTPLKRTTHIPSGIHILRCINIQPKDSETFTINSKPHLPKNYVPPNGLKPALPETDTRLQKSYSTLLKRTTHIPCDAHILRCINIQSKDWETFLDSDKSNLPENCVLSNCRKRALPKTATRLQESYSTPLKRTIHIPRGTHISRCINIQPKDWENILGSGKPNLPENRAPHNGRKPALPKTATHLQKSYSMPLKHTTHIPCGTHILRCINMQPRDWEAFTVNSKPHPPGNCVPYNCRKCALPKTTTRLRGLNSPHLLAATHLQNKAISLR